MGFMDQLKKIARPYAEDDEEEFDEFAPSVNTEPQFTKTEQAPRYSQTITPAPESSNKVVTIPATTQLQVVLVNPINFENASEIADHLGSRRTVVLNLESTPKDIARRLIDFLSGVTYALDGKIKKVAVSTYILTPFNVDIMGELMDELENSGLYN